MEVVASCENLADREPIDEQRTVGYNDCFHEAGGGCHIEDGPRKRCHKKVAQLYDIFVREKVRVTDDSAPGTIGGRRIYRDVHLARPVPEPRKTPQRGCRDV
jgi:hypothetical protein